MLIAYIMDGWMPLDDPNDKASKIKYCIYAFMYLLNTSKNSSRMKAPGKLLAGVGWGGGAACLLCLVLDLKSLEWYMVGVQKNTIT